MSAPQLFSNGEFELPVIPDGEGFRVHGMVVARQLGFREAYAMVRTLDEDEKVLIKEPQVKATTNLGVGSDLGLVGAAADHGVWYLTEAGFYRIVGQRNINAIKDPHVRDAVHRFQRWVFHDVLPAMLRTGHATEQRVVGTTWSWDDVAAEIRQRYGLDYRPSEITGALRAAGWLKAGSTVPKHDYRWKFWFTGTAYHVLPHVLPELVAALVPTLQKLGDPQANQYRLNLSGGAQGRAEGLELHAVPEASA